ncbi:hypothetical protein PUN4_180154 [Paraburkholderia unamae]|nr:hypothetical protein PUN4_180154 [Paraburkholderia unamae]
MRRKNAGAICWCGGGRSFTGRATYIRTHFAGVPLIFVQSSGWAHQCLAHLCLVALYKFNFKSNAC